MNKPVMNRKQSVQMRDAAKLCLGLAKGFKNLEQPVPLKTIVYLEESARMLKLARYWAHRVNNRF